MDGRPISNVQRTQHLPLDLLADVPPVPGRLHEYVGDVDEELCLELVVAPVRGPADSHDALLVVQPVHDPPPDGPDVDPEQGGHLFERDEPGPVVGGQGVSQHGKNIPQVHMRWGALDGAPPANLQLLFGPARG